MKHVQPTAATGPVSTGVAGFLAALLFALGISPGTAEAAPRDFAAGVSIGSPMGLSLLQNIGETEAVQAAIEVGVQNPFTIQSDYLWKIRWPQAFEERYGKAWIYYGGGMRYEYGERDLSFAGPYRHTESARLALRAPVGTQYYLPRLPFDAFAEIAPMLALWPASLPDLTFALGFRFNL
jgi:hypothetical protein